MQPNILMIVTDQQRRDTIGAYGSQLVQTPHIDHLAREGMTFDYAFTPCGLCSPVRSSMLTGVYPHAHNALTNNKLHPVRTELQPEQDVLCRGLKDAGYQMGYTGKWHVNNKFSPIDFGFDEYVSLGDYDEYRQSVVGKPRPAAANNYITLHSGADEIDAQQSRPAFLTDHAIRMVNTFGQNEERPFFIRLDFHGPHPPNVIPEPYASMYEPDLIPPHSNFEDSLEGKPAVQRIKRQHWQTEPMTWVDWQPLVARYYGEISLIDDQIGRLLAELDALGLAENTLVLFFSDHGDTMGAHKIWNKDYTMYDEIYRVPFIARWPEGIEPGSRCDEYIHHGVDLLPTLFEAAKLDMPEKIHGRSMLPLMQGETQNRLREAFAEFHGCHMGLYSMRMIQTDRFHYIFHTNDIDELYDHEIDPHEMNNVAYDADYADVLKDMRQRLVHWMAKTDDHLYNEWVVFWLTEDKEQARHAPGRMNTSW